MLSQALLASGGFETVFFEGLGVDDLYVWLRVDKSIIDAVLVKK